MEKILENLKKDDVLYETSKNTKYLFVKRDVDLGIVYSINKNQKTLPLRTINAAIRAEKAGEVINRKWYKSYNEKEYSSRPCNYSVLKKLLTRQKN